jgi:hypothetical protein
VVRTSPMLGGGLLGLAGVFAGGALVGEALAEGAEELGMARKLRSLAKGALKATASGSAVEGEVPLTAVDLAATADSGCRPGVAETPPMFSPSARTGRPLGGANLSP